MRSTNPLLVTAVLLACCAPAGAQDAPRVASGSTFLDSTARPRLVISEHAIAAAIEPAARKSAQPSRARDSVRNGATAGAIVGGIAAGAFGGLLCKAMQAPGEPSCWRAVLVAGPLGAGIGAATGAAVDAMLARAPGTRLEPPVSVLRQ